jgi:hypothetical protein
MPELSFQRLVFVGGLHRSGTTLLARLIASHPEASGFRETGVPEDEGQHLQSVIPPALAHGGPGRFAFDEKARLDEHSELCGPAARARLLAEWGRHWDLTKRVLVEKSPPNLVRMRFLQALFPESYFVMIVRHPLAVAYATRKWARVPLRELVRHWVRAHEIFAEDAPHVRRLKVVRYEDLVKDPGETLASVFGFLGLSPVSPEVSIERDLDDRYLARWRRDRLKPRHWRDAGALHLKWKKPAERLGYFF